MPPSFDPSDPPGPLAIVRQFLGAALALATVAIVVIYFDSGHVDGRLLTFVGVLWIFWGLFSDVFGLVLGPLAGFIGGQLTGTGSAGPPVSFDIDREAQMLERLLADPPPFPHREILAAIRLAEIYRTHQHDRVKSDALLARMRAKYPDAPELGHDLVSP